MGKLHSLRCAITRNPTAWFGDIVDWGYYVHVSKMGTANRKIRTEHGAEFVNGSWRPTGTLDFADHSYRPFVRHVLHGLGYKMGTVCPNCGKVHIHKPSGRRSNR